MADKKLTPMMELFNDIEKHIQFTPKYKATLLEKERQMVVDAYEHKADGTRYTYGNDYYNETFKTK